MKTKVTWDEKSWKKSQKISLDIPRIFFGVMKHEKLEHGDIPDISDISV